MVRVTRAYLAIRMGVLAMGVGRSAQVAEKGEISPSVRIEFGQASGEISLTFDDPGGSRSAGALKC